MSREAIALAIGETEYPSGYDDVEPELRLAQVDALLDTGTVIDVDDILYEEQKATWHELSRVMPKLGWKPIVTYTCGDVVVYWSLPNTTREQLDERKSPHIDIDWGQGVAGDILWNPCVSDGDEDDNPGSIHFKSVSAFLAWLQAP